MRPYRLLLHLIRLYDLALEMDIEAGSMGCVLNRARNHAGINRARELFEGTPVRILGTIPEDTELIARDAEGEPIWTLSDDNAVRAAAGRVFARLRR